MLQTRVLVTHGVSYLPYTDHIIVLKEGHISEQGSYQQLLSRDGAFAVFISEYLADLDSDDQEGRYTCTLL